MTHCQNQISCAECWEKIVPNETGFFTVVFAQGNTYHVCQTCFGNPDLSQWSGDEIVIFESTAPPCPCGHHYSSQQEIAHSPKGAITLDGLKVFLGITYGTHTQFGSHSPICTA